MRYKFLLPYSPNYNPIELAFSAIKLYIARNGSIICEAMTDQDDSDVYNFLCTAVHSVTEEQTKGWFLHCGYY